MKNESGRGQVPSDLAFVFSATVALLPFFIVLKLLLVIDDLHAGATAAPGPVRFVLRVVLGLHRDVLFIAILGACAWALLRMVRRWWILAWITRVAVLVGYAIVAGWATGTFFIWRVVSGMLTYPLYRLSGGIFDLEASVLGATRSAVPWLAGSALGFIVLHEILWRTVPFDRMAENRGRWSLLLGTAFLATGACAVVLRNSGVDIRETPIAFFVRSWALEPPDFGAGEAVKADDDPLFHAPKNAAPRTKTDVRIDGKRPNVILLVLESTGANYMHAFHGKWDNTPVLDGLKESAVFFDRAYAHAPMTNESALTLQCSVYPRTGSTPTVGAVTRLKMADLAGELHSQGYGTAFMCQTLLGWQGQQFFKDRHFDHYSEAYEYWRDWGGTRTMDDRTLIPRALKWIDESPKDKPFFLMMWTYQGHYPCYSVDAPKPYEPGHAPFNRYLNAIREDDRFVGELMASLKERNLLDSTLIVVTGDHGQVFSPESTTRSTRNLSELAVQVPLVFINKSLLTKAGVDSRLARHIDIAPTVLDLLGMNAPPSWQGTSLFRPEAVERVFLTSSYTSPTLYGLVDGHRKYITDGVHEHLFDLAIDPEEKQDLAGEPCVACREYHDQLVSWHRFQPKYLDRIGR